MPTRKFNARPHKSASMRKAARRRRRIRVMRTGGVLFLLMAAVLTICGLLTWPGVSAVCLLGAAFCALVGAILCFVLRVKLIWIVAILIAALLGGSLLTNEKTISVGGVNCRADIVELDLSTANAKDLKNVDRLENLQILNVNGLGLQYDPVLELCTELRHLDFRGNQMEKEQYDQLSAALPRCEILWDVRVNGRAYDAGTVDFVAQPDVAGGYDDIVLIMENLKALETADVSAIPLTEDEIKKLMNQFPNVKMHYTTELYGVRAATNARALDLSGCAIQDTQELIVSIAAFDDLSELNVLNTGLTYADIKRINAAYPNVKVTYTVTLADRTFASDAALVDLSGVPAVSLNALIEGLVQFQALTALDLTDTGYSEEDIATLKVYFPDINIRWTVDIMGQTVNSDTKAIDLSASAALPADALINAIAPLSSLELVDVHTHSYTFDEYRQLIAAKPGVTFLCTISAYGKTLDTAQQNVDLRGANITAAADLAEMLRLFPNLREVDLRDTGLPAADLILLDEAVGDAKLIANVRVLGGMHETTATSLTAEDGYEANAEEIIPALSLFPDLTRIDPNGSALSQETLNRLREAYPHVFIADQYALYGRNFMTDTDTVDISGIRILNFTPLKEALSNFPYLKTLNVQNTGISPAALTELRAAYPNLTILAD